MNRLSTHVLDTSRGQPAANIPVVLFRGDREISSHITDAGGRCQDLLPEGETLDPGVYRLRFDLVGYLPEGLYPEVLISFRVGPGTAHYHIPLLISPFGYTTYRGS
jgi:5-hydroxyisourate hydrolase